MVLHGETWPSFLLLLYCFYCATEKTVELVRYDTAYACEGKTLKIGCKDGEIIKLIRANYGRYSITICNDHGNTEWSVNCMSPKSLRVLHNRCHQVQNCSVLASTLVFGDPCPGTLKYLEAHFQCISTSTTTSTIRPSPPWLITSQPPVWSTLKATMKISMPTLKLPSTPVNKIQTTLSVSPNYSFVGTSPISIPPVNQGISVKVSTTGLYNLSEDNILTAVTPIYPNRITDPPDLYDYPTQPSNSRTIIKDIDELNYCHPTTVRTIYWNWTVLGDLNIQPCPVGTTGFARWRCLSADSGAHWFPQTPDLSECRSLWLTSLEQRLLTGKDRLTAITNDLAQVTSSNKTLYGGDMMITTMIIQNIAQKMSIDIQTVPDPRQREAIVTEMLAHVIKTGSNLLDSLQHASWQDLTYKEQMRVATTLLIGLEENAFLLADTMIKQKTVDQMVKNILLSVRVLEIHNIQVEKFPTSTKWTAGSVTIELPRGALLENSEGGLVRLVFVAFARLEEILLWNSDGNLNNTSKVLNSKVISASLGKGRHIQLHEAVRITFKHLKTENVSNPLCVFWDYTINSWSKEGCNLEHTNNSHTTCLCDHLTNFAILMDVDKTGFPIGHKISLQIITYSGCIISIVCLTFAIITFHLHRSLKNDRTTIHCNLCLCLLSAEVLFLVGIDQTTNKLGCGIIAAILHYLFLSTFVWMFFEGFQLYIMLIEVFESEKSRLQLYYLVAYGVPLAIVIISGAVFPTGYGTAQYCWLRVDNYFIYSFVGPVIVVTMLNLIFLSMAIVMMCRYSNSSVCVKNKEHSRLASISTSRAFGT